MTCEIRGLVYVRASRRSLMRHSAFATLGHTHKTGRPLSRELASYRTSPANWRDNKVICDSKTKRQLFR